MKICDLVYERPDFEGMTRRYDALRVRLQKAETMKEAEACLLEGSALRREFSSMCNLASIRFETDIRDKTCAEEYELVKRRRQVVDRAGCAFRRAMAESPFRPDLERRYPSVYFAEAEQQITLTTPEAAQLMEQEVSLQVSYQKKIAGIRIPFAGKSHTTQEINRFLEDPDRRVRRAACVALGKALHNEARDLGELLRRLVHVRTELAQRAGQKDYVEYVYRQKIGGYSEQDLVRFRSFVRQDIVPLLSELHRQQCQRLDIDRLTPYDQRLFGKHCGLHLSCTGEALFQQIFDAFRELCPETEAMVSHMLASGAFDLDSRPGKAAGGHCGYLPSLKTPYVFANFTGTSFDVTGLTHECGHALEFFLTRENPLTADLQPSCDHQATGAVLSHELCEAHAGSMEFLCWPYFSRFFGADAEKAQIIHLIKTLTVLPEACLNDEFEQGMYREPDMSFEELCTLYQKLTREYLPDLDYEDIPYYSEGMMWSRIIHFFCYPLYYISYALAYVTSLQIVEPMLRGHHPEALAKYLTFTGSGGTHSFVDTLRICNISDPFCPDTIKTLSGSLRGWLEQHMGILQ